MQEKTVPKWGVSESLQSHIIAVHRTLRRILTSMYLLDEPCTSTIPTVYVNLD